MNRILAALFAVSIFVTACGGSDTSNEPTTTTTQPATAVDPSALERVMNERWDADCVALLDDAIASAQGVIDVADPLSTSELAEQSSALTDEFAPIQAALTEQFANLGCSQFWWDINLVDNAETLSSTSMAGFVTKFGFLETSITNIAGEYGAVVGELVESTPEPVPQQPPLPNNIESCDEVYRALLDFQRYQVDLADHLATLPATPPDGYQNFAVSYAAATQTASDDLDCDTLAAATFIIANETDLAPNSFYGRYAKYLAFNSLLRQAEF